MKRNHAAVAILLAVTVAVIALMWLRQNRQPTSKQSAANAPPPNISQQTAPPPPATGRQAPPVVLPSEVAAKLSESDQKKVGKILQAFKAPIDFYGKVVDEKGQPVASAKVHYSAADQFFGDSSKYEDLSDENGFFSIRGIKGAGLFVNVAKDGYYGTNESGGGFGYGVPSGRQPPSKGNPAVFVLRRKGEAEPLVYVSTRQYKVPRDGTPFQIDLRTGRQVAAGAGDVRIERWANERDKDAARRFDWKCRISVPGGGAIERTGAFDFEAPENGYLESVEIDMPKSLATNWQRTKRAEYFLRLRNGLFARINVTMYAGHDNFLVLESFLNPHLGSRNLEYDPAKQASAR